MQNLLWDTFFATAMCNQDREAVVVGGRRVSYAQLVQEIESCAASPFMVGLPPGSIVGLYLANGLEFVTAFWALARAGHIALTLNTKYQEGELQHYLRHRPVAALIVAETDLVRMGGLFASEQRTTQVVTLAPQSEASGLATPEPASATATSPVLMQFSTGSTGLPKGVVRTQGNVLTEVQAARACTGVQPSDRVAAIVPLYHAHGFANAMCAALLAGATLVVATEFEPRAATQLLADERITVLPSVPFMVKMLGSIRLPSQPDFSALRLCFTAGAALPAADAARFKERFGVTVHQLYGSTETGAVALSYTPSEEVDRDVSAVGRPLSHATIAIFDEAGGLLPAGEIGEIGLATAAAAAGYDGNPVATEAAFRHGHFFPGDLGRLDAHGRLTITGRKSLFINAGGNKVDPVEIEEVLLRHAAVKEAVVLGVPSSMGGEIIKAVVVTEGDVTRELLLAHCGLHLGTFKLPKLIEFRDEIPKSPLGKVLRKYLI